MLQTIDSGNEPVSKYRDVVEAGCSLLSHQCPGWLDKVNLTILDLSNDLDCVLGQVYGSYARGVTGLRVLINANVYGFTIFSNEETSDEEWAKLTDEWKRQIRKLRNQQ